MSRTDVFKFVIIPGKTFLLCEVLFLITNNYAIINICRDTQGQIIKGKKILLHPYPFPKSTKIKNVSRKNYIIVLQVDLRIFAWNIFLYTNVDDCKNQDLKILKIG